MNFFFFSDASLKTNWPRETFKEEDEYIENFSQLETVSIPQFLF